MKRENIFYIILVLTILVIRMGVFLFPMQKIIINGIIINHFWIGIIIIFIVLLLPKKYNQLKIVMFSIGLGITIDELIFVVIGGRTISDYWSIYSIFGVIVMATIIFAIRKGLVRKL